MSTLFIGFLGISSVVFYFSIWAILIIIETILIKKKKNKAKWILPTIVLIISIFIAVPTSQITYGRGSMDTIQLYDKNYDEFGRIYVVIDFNRNPIAFSHLIIEDGENSKYINFSINNGDITESKGVIKYKANIEKAIKEHNYSKKIDGNSVTYGKLLDIEKGVKNKIKKFTKDSIAPFIFQAFTLPFILFSICTITTIQNKRKRRLEETKIQDL